MNDFDLNEKLQQEFLCNYYWHVGENKIKACAYWYLRFYYGKLYSFHDAKLPESLVKDFNNVTVHKTETGYLSYQPNRVGENIHNLFKQHEQYFNEINQKFEYQTSSNIDHYDDYDEYNKYVYNDSYAFIFIFIMFILLLIIL